VSARRARLQPRRPPFAPQGRSVRVRRKRPPFLGRLFMTVNRTKIAKAPARPKRLRRKPVKRASRRNHECDKQRDRVTVQYGTNMPNRSCSAQAMRSANEWRPAPFRRRGPQHWTMPLNEIRVRGRAQQHHHDSGNDKRGHPA